MKSPSSHFKNAICINYSSCMKKAYSIESQVFFHFFLVKKTYSINPEFAIDWAGIIHYRIVLSQQSR